jgi:hypothetical protein
MKLHFRTSTFAASCAKFLALPLLFSFVLLPARADQIVMKNGDRVTGSIVRKDGKNLTIKTDQFGEVTASWDQVQSIQTEKPVTVVLQDGRTTQGTLATVGGSVEITAPQAKITAAPGDITAIRNTDEQKAYDRLQRPRLTELWSGTGTLGFAGTSGNARTLTFTTGVNAARITNTDKTSIYFNAIKASALVGGTNSDTAEAVRGGWAYSHDVRPKLFVSVFNDFEYDKFQDLDLRYVVGGDFGYHLMKSKRSQLDVLGGADYNHASFFTPVTTPPTPRTPNFSAAEYMFGDDYNLKLNGAASLVQSMRFFDAFSDTGAYRMNFDVGTSTKIGKWLTWNVSLSDRYLSHPAFGRKTNDFLYTTGLGITFAR